MDKKGVALIEILVSMIVLATAALAVTATIAMVSSKQMRSAGGSSLDLQALDYARQTLESLRDAVSTDATRAAPLTPGTHNDPLPAGNLASHGGARSYLVSGVAGTDLTRVKVTVTWAD